MLKREFYTIAKIHPMPSCLYMNSHGKHIFRYPVEDDGREIETGETRISKIDLSLLSTCRAIYSEARYIPFSVNLFSTTAGPEYLADLLG